MPRSSKCSNIFSETQTVAEWRDQSKMEVSGQKTRDLMPTVLADGGMPKLFGAGMAASFPPVDALLIPPRPPKPGTPGYPKPPGGWPGGTKPAWAKAPKLYAPTPPAGLERQLMVRLARKQLLTSSDAAALHVPWPQKGSEQPLSSSRSSATI